MQSLRLTPQMIEQHTGPLRALQEEDSTSKGGGNSRGKQRQMVLGLSRDTVRNKGPRAVAWMGPWERKNLSRRGRWRTRVMKARTRENGRRSESDPIWGGVQSGRRAKCSTTGDEADQDKTQRAQVGYHMCIPIHEPLEPANGYISRRKQA